MSGIIDMRELRMLGIGVDQLKELPEFAKKSKAELHDLMKSGGSITEDQVFTLIEAKGPDPSKLGDMANAMSKTVGARMSKVFELPEQYIQKLSKGAGLETLNGKFGEILAALDPDGPRGSAIFGSLERSFETIVGKVSEIDFEKVANEIETEVIPGIEGMIKSIASVDWVGGARELYSYIKDTKDIIVQIVDGVKEFGKILHDNTPIGYFQDQAAKSDSYANKAKDGRLFSQQDHGDVANFINRKTPIGFINDVGAIAFDKIVDTMKTPIVGRGSQDFQDAIPFKSPSTADRTDSEVISSMPGRAAAGADYATPHFEAAGRDASAGYIRGLMSGAPAADAAGAGMAMAAHGGVATAQDSHSPSRKFARLGGDAVDGYVDELADGAGDARRAGADLAGAGIAGADSVPSRARRTAMGLGDFDPGSVAPGVADPAGPSGASDGQDRGAPPAPAFASAQPSGGTGARAVTITIPITISVGDGARPRDAEQAVERLRTMLPGALTSALEQLGIEAGV